MNSENAPNSACQVAASGGVLRPWVLGAFTALCAMAVYLPSLPAEFLLLDDPQYVTANPYVLYPNIRKLGWTFAEIWHPSVVYGYYQPITMASLMLDRLVEAYLSGGFLPVPDPFVFHFSNVLLHGVNAALVFWVALGLLRRQSGGAAAPLSAHGPEDGKFAAPVALACGLVFALHPLNVEVVSWVAQRKAILATLFSLLMVMAHVRYAERRGVGWLIAVLAAYLACVLSKPTSLLMPLVLLAVDVWPLRRFSRAAVVEKIPLFVAAALCGYAAYVSQTAAVDLTDSGHHRPLGASLLIACHNLVFYLAKIALPIRLCPQYVMPDETTIALSSPSFAAGFVGALALLAVLAWSLARRAAFIWTLIASFVLLIGPTITPVRFTGTIAADRFAYTPMIVVIVFLGTAAHALLARRRGAAAPLGAAAAIVLAAMALATHRQQSVWQNSFAYYTSVYERFPDSPNGHYGMGNAWLTRFDRYRGKFDDASRRAGDECLQNALAAYREVMRSDATFSHAYYRIGYVLILQGHLAEGIAAIEEGLSLPKADPEGYFFLGLAYSHAGAYDKAIEPYEICLRRQPSWPEVSKNLGNALLRTGHAEESLKHFERLYELNPTDLDGRQNWGVALLKLGRAKEALAILDPVVQLRAQVLEQTRARAAAAGTSVNAEDAAELSQRARNLADARYTLAAAHCMTGDLAAAFDELRAAIARVPRLLEDARDNPAFRALHDSPDWERLNAGVAPSAPATAPAN